MDVGGRLRYYRKCKDLSQESVSGKAVINEKYYGRVERGESCPTIDKLEKICEAIGISVIELSLYDVSKEKERQLINSRLMKIIINGLKQGADIHFNRNMLIEGLERSIWYNGYIGSFFYDEFEIIFKVLGNIKGKLYINYEKVLDLNSQDVYSELIKYYREDEKLFAIIQNMAFDEETLVENNGTVLFLEDNNSIEATLINHSTGAELNKVYWDDDNVIKVFEDQQALIDYIFDHA